MKITPEEFKEKMLEIYKEKSGDEEVAHAMMDDLMADLLTELGYGEGIEIFNKQEKWYS